MKRRAKKIKGGRKRRPSDSYPVMKNRLDTKFQAMIRARDSGLRCISCEERRVEQAGHFISRGCDATRWNPRNVNGQCTYCNGFVEGGNQWLHGIGINRKWGEGTTERLWAHKRAAFNWERFEIGELLAAVAAGYDQYVITYEKLVSGKLGGRDERDAG